MKKPKKPKLSDVRAYAEREIAKRMAVRVLIGTFDQNMQWPTVDGMRRIPWPTPMERSIVARGIAALS